MVKCKNCGEEIDKKNFCPKCGTKNEIKICPSCESELDDDDIFCPECGEKIKDEPSEEKTEETSDEKDETSDEEEKTEDASDEKEEKTEDNNEEESSDEKEEKTEDKKVSKELKTCPHCNTKIEDDDAEYCLECGKPINADLQSSGIKETIQVKKLIIFSIISIIFSIFVSLIFSFIFGMIGQTTDLYPIGFFISLLIIIAIFGSFKDLLNGGLLGIITGLVTGLLCNGIVELSGGFAFSYQMFSGYAPIIFTIFGAIVGVISTKYLRKSVTKYIDVEKLF